MYNIHLQLSSSKECTIWKLVNNKVSIHIGTAGVWRVSAINEAGGWKDRTAVEDMDLAVRATLKGWKFLYINELRVYIQLISKIQLSM